MLHRWDITNRSQPVRSRRAPPVSLSQAVDSLQLLPHPRPVCYLLLVVDDRRRSNGQRGWVSAGAGAGLVRANQAMHEFDDADNREGRWCC